MCEYDDDYTEFEDQCRYCGSKFTNEGLHGLNSCPHCEEDDDAEAED